MRNTQVIDSMKSRRRISAWMQLSGVAMMLSVTACESFTSGTGASDACLFLKPITFSRADTVETQEQILDYLTTYEALCGTPSRD